MTLVNKIGGIGASAPRPGSTPVKKGAEDFGALLQRELVKQNELRFSVHALRRLSERQIELSPADLQKINQAATLAQNKGARQSLLIYGDLALVTSIDNRTVVTAVDNASNEQRVFTNIDSAVIVK